MHYTDQPSRLEPSDDPDAAVLRLEGGGFLTASMIERALDRMRDAGPVQPNILIDLRDVAGYDSAAVAEAHQLLQHAPAFGVRRIAFVASSAAVHTATQVASSRATVPLRSFQSERSARAWLAG